MMEELSCINTWSFNVFRVAKACRGTTLSIVGTRLFEDHALPVRFNIKPQTLAAFLDAVEAGYKANPYHNAIHGGAWVCAWVRACARMSQAFVRGLETSGGPPASPLPHSIALRLLRPADVAQSLHFFLHAGGMDRWLGDTLVLASLTAALVHDIVRPCAGCVPGAVPCAD